MEILMSLQDSCVVFQIHLIGNFHLQINNNNKIEIVIYVFLQNYYDLQDAF